MLPLLVAAADFLIFGRRLGLNLFLYVIILSAGILLAGNGGHRTLKMGIGMALAGIAAVPLAIEPTLAAIAVSLCALILLSLASVGLLPRRTTAIPAVFLRFLIHVPVSVGLFLGRLSALRTPYERKPIRLRALRAWIMPLVLTVLFIVLFAIANPLVEMALNNIDLMLLVDLIDVWRIPFWLAAAGFVQLLLYPRLQRRKARPVAGIETVEWDSTLFGKASLVRALGLFNAVFAVETLLDIIYLWGGAGLPTGISHAEYAHRGAYPLVATALLAAAFVLIAMRHGGPGERSPLIRKLVYIWIGQNVLLCLSAMLRLELYVEVYSLTWLRIAAGIWMGLVAIGLALILFRIGFRRSNEWLVAMNLASLVSVLYASAFIDFPALIARFNVAHSFEMTGEGLSLDVDYLSQLGPTAIPAMDDYIQAAGSRAASRARMVAEARSQLVLQFEDRPRGWRSWTYQQSRLEHYLSDTPSVANSPKSDNNTLLNELQE